VKAFAFLMIKIGLMAFLITHYVACCLYFLPILFRHVKHNEFTRHNANPQSRSLARFINFYLNNSYSATSLVLGTSQYKFFFFNKLSTAGVEVDFNYKSPWITYVFCIIIYVVGKFLSTYVTGKYHFCSSSSCPEYHLCSHTCGRVEGVQLSGDEILRDDESS
jgi:hypothetical protein